MVNSTSLCITIELPKQSETCRFNRLKVIQFTDKTLSTSKDFYAEGVEDAKDSASVYIDGLTTGHVYYFAAQAVFDNCEGFPSDLVDGVSGRRIHCRLGVSLD